MNTRLCKDCICFHTDLSLVNPDFPPRSGCIECAFSLKLPRDRSAKTPTKELGTCVTLHDANDDAANCTDFTPAH